MAKRTSKQIQESLLEQYKVWRRGSGTDLPPLEGGGGGGGLGSTTSGRSSGGDIFGLGGRGGSPMQIDIGLGGAGRGSTAAGKPRVRPTSAELARHELGLKLQGQGFKKSSTDTSNTQSGAKVYRPGGPEKLSALPQTPQERLVAQSQLAQRGQDTAEPATFRDLIAAVPGLTKTKMAGTALGGGLIGAGLGLKGVELLSDPSSAEQERAEWLEKFDARSQKSNQELKDIQQSIERSQGVLDRLQAKKDKKQMKENKHPRKATRTLQQIEESLRASLAEQNNRPQSRLRQMMTPMPVPKSMQQEPGEAGKTIAGMLPGVGTAVDVADIAKGDYSGVPYMALGLVPGGKLLKGPLKRAAKWFGKKGDDVEDLAAAARKRVEPKFEPGKAEAPKVEPKPKVTVKPGETMDQAILRTEREKIAKARNDQVGAKVWRPGEGKPKVWRRGEGPDRGGKPPSGKEPASRSKQAIEDYRNAMRELRDPNTPEERRKALRNSLAVNAGFLALLGLTFQKDKDIPPPGGSEAGADDRGRTWVEVDLLDPTDTNSKDAVTEPKSSAAVTKDPATAPEKPIQEPDIATDQIKPSKKTDVTRPDEKSAKPEREAPKKDQPVEVPEPKPAKPTPGEKTTSTDGGSPGRTDTPSVQPKKEPGTTPDGRGDRTSPADGTGPKPGTTPGPKKGTGTGTDSDYEYRPGYTGLPFKEQALAEKYFDYKHNYQNFVQEDNQPVYTRDQYIGWAKKYAEQYGVPLSIVLHAMYRESGFYGNAEKMRVAKSPTGARGVMQIQPEYAEKGVYKIKIEDLLDPEKNIEAGTRGLAYYFNKYKDPQKALAAYNAGESGAKTYLRTGDPKTIRTAQTKDYIKDFQDDVIHQLEKFYPKNKQKVAQVATEILGTAVGAGNAQAADQRPQTTTKVTKTDADPNRVRKGKISIGNVVKNLATGQYTDYDTGKPVTDPAKIANFERLYRGEPEKTNTAASTAGEETFLDKVKRVAAGELTSKVFGGDKKSTVTPVKAEPKAVAPAAPSKKDDEESWFERLYGIKAAREKQAEIAADVARQEAERKKAAEKPTTVQSTSGVIDYSGNSAAAPKSKLTIEPPDSDPETDPKAWAEYDERMEKLQAAAGDKFSQERAARLEKERRQAQASKTNKSADVTTLLQKDQSGLAQAKQAYRGSLASQRLQALNPEITDVNRIEVGQKINLPGQSEPYTVKKGDTLDKIASRAEKSLASTTNDQRQTIDTPYGKVTKGTEADYQRWLAQQSGLPQTYYTSPTSPKLEPSSLEKTSGDNDSANSSQNVTKSLAPNAIPPFVSKKFDADERAAIVDKVIKDLEADSNKTASDEIDDIETLLKDIGYTGQEPEKPVRTIDNDDEVEPVTVDADAQLKESINTKPNAELHDILKLAGRI